MSAASCLPLATSQLTASNSASSEASSRLSPTYGDMSSGIIAPVLLYQQANVAAIAIALCA